MGTSARGTLDDKSGRYQAAGETNQVDGAPEVSPPVLRSSIDWGVPPATGGARPVQTSLYGISLSDPLGVLNMEGRGPVGGHPERFVPTRAGGWRCPIFSHSLSPGFSRLVSILYSPRC